MRFYLFVRLTAVVTSLQRPEATRELGVVLRFLVNRNKKGTQGVVGAT